MGHSSLQKSVTVVTESRLDNVGLVGVAVRAICESIPLSGEVSRDIELCVVEAVTNAVKHAYGSQSGHTVETAVFVFGDRITIQISDTGTSMETRKCSPECVDLDFDPNEIASLPECGMGLRIIRSVMDGMSYQVVDGKNTLTLTKKF